MRKSHGSPLDQDAASILKAEVIRKGLKYVAKEISISPQSITRALSGMTIHSGTASLIRSFVGRAMSKR